MGKEENVEKMIIAPEACRAGKENIASCTEPDQQGENEWAKHDSVWWKSFGSIGNGSEKVAAFDLDGTLILPLHGQLFPKGRDDWKWFGAMDENQPKLSFDKPKRQKLEDSSSLIRNKLRKLVDEGYKIIIFTNQKGVSLGLQHISQITGRIDDIQSQLDVPMQAFVLTEGDLYRKPLSACWDFAILECNNDVAVDKSNSFFVGDAAGRPARGKTHKKDHSAADVKFALNVGIAFFTPEEYFLGLSDFSAPKEFEFDPRKIGLGAVSPAIFGDDTVSTEVVVLVGPPGSGKSTFSKRFFPTYTHINQDILKTKQKCVEACKNSISKGNSCIIDNQNLDTETRKAYIDIALEHAVKCRCVFMDIPKELAFHLNAYRMLNTRLADHRPQKVPPMVIHSFYKNVDRPSKTEGFTSVESLTLETFQAGPFKDPQDEKLFRSFLE